MTTRDGASLQRNFPSNQFLPAIHSSQSGEAESALKGELEEGAAGPELWVPTRTRFTTEANSMFYESTPLYVHENC